MSVCLKWDAGMPHFGVLKGTIEAEKPLELESQPGTLQQSGLVSLLLCELLSKNGSPLFPCSWWKSQLNIQ
jgi:hypothetical protein